MRVRSSTIESHNFTKVRRRGYDPAEVDAAMGRLANTLREYEAMTAELEVKLRETDDASEAVHRTFVAAQRTRDEIIAAATQEADELVASARARADEIIGETGPHIDAMLAGAAADTDGRYAAATATRAGAELDAERVRAEANEILEIAKAAAGSARAEALQVTAAAMTDAAERVSAAQSQSNEILEHAQIQAEEIVEEARRNKERLERRAAQVRTAVSDIERELRELAEATLERTGSIAEMMDLEHPPIDLTDSTADPADVSPAGAGPAVSDPADANVVPTVDPHPALERQSRTVIAETTDTDTVGGPVGMATVIESTDVFDSAKRRRSELEALAQLVRARTMAFAEPDGSGRPPADRRLLDPETTRQGSDPSETLYQRRARGLRARLRQEGQDPTQRGR